MSNLLAETPRTLILQERRDAGFMSVGVKGFLFLRHHPKLLLRFQ
jgi:hypothetical protein